MDIGALF